MASGRITKFLNIRRGSVTGTTDNTGDMELTGFRYDTGYRIICIESVSRSNTLVIIFHGTTPNFVHVTDLSGNILANTELTVTFYYNTVS